MNGVGPNPEPGVEEVPESGSGRNRNKRRMAWVSLILFCAMTVGVTLAILCSDTLASRVDKAAFFLAGAGSGLIAVICAYFGVSTYGYKVDMNLRRYGSCSPTPSPSRLSPLHME